MIRLLNHWIPSNSRTSLMKFRLYHEYDRVKAAINHITSSSFDIRINHVDVEYNEFKSMGDMTNFIESSEISSKELAMAIADAFLKDEEDFRLMDEKLEMLL